MILAYYIGMNDDTILINGKPATDAQLRKLVGLDKASTLTQRIAKVQAEFFEGLPEWYTKKKMQ